MQTLAAAAKQLIDNIITFIIYLQRNNSLQACLS